MYIIDVNELQLERNAGLPVANVRMGKSRYSHASGGFLVREVKILETAEGKLSHKDDDVTLGAFSFRYLTD